MSIYIDSSATLHVTRCTDCPYWFAARLTKTQAHDRAAEHERDHHPDSENARRAARMYAARHAADSSNVPTHSASSSGGNH